MVVLLGYGIFLVKRPERVEGIHEVLPFFQKEKGATAPVPGAAPNAEKVSSPEPSAPLVAFLEREAASFNAPKVDSEAAERRVQEQAALLTESDLEFLAQKAQGVSSRASDRILSAYLLVAAKQRGWKALRDLAVAPLQGNPNPAPHTVDETLSMQEKAIRIMAIDGLFEQAMKDRAAREEFLRLVSELRDPTLAAYAQKRVRELPSL